MKETREKTREGRACKREGMNKKLREEVRIHKTKEGNEREKNDEVEKKEEINENRKRYGVREKNL